MTVRPNTVQTVRAMLLSDGTYATTLLVWVLDYFGPEVLEWHPETIKMELEEAFAVKLPKANLDKLLAIITILTTDLFFKNAARFIQLANILAGDDFQPDEFEPADSAECAWAVTEALLLVPPSNEDPEPFSDEVRAYIGQTLRDEGYVTPPDVLRIALDADFSDKVRYNFADDPELFQGIYEVQQGKTEEIKQILAEGLQELIEQLQALPLQTGNTSELAKRISQTLKKTGG